MMPQRAAYHSGPRLLWDEGRKEALHVGNVLSVQNAAQRDGRKPVPVPHQPVALIVWVVSCDDMLQPQRVFAFILASRERFSEDASTGRVLTVGFALCDIGPKTPVCACVVDALSILLDTTVRWHDNLPEQGFSDAIMNHQS